MNSLIDSEHGIAALLASIAVVLCLHLVLGIGKLVLTAFKKKVEKSDTEITQISLALHQNTEAVRELRIQIGVLERELKDMHKVKVDTQRLFSAVKIMAGKKWVEIRKAIAADNLPRT